MKCKFCDGSGKDYWELNGVPYPCPVCNGTGEHINDANRMTTCEFCGGTGVTEPLTNEEWFCQLSTEEKAKFLAAQQLHGGTIASRSDVDWEVWLEEKHNEIR